MYNEWTSERDKKNRVNTEYWVLKDGLGIQLRVIHVHSEHLRVQHNLSLIQTFMALFFSDRGSLISLPSWRPNKAKSLTAHKELFRSLKYNCDNQDVNETLHVSEVGQTGALVQLLKATAL